MPTYLPQSPVQFLCLTKKKIHSGVVFFILFTQIQCIPYLFHLGKEQSKIILGREKIESVLESPHLEPKIKEKLKLIQEARKFAISKLSLNEKGGFEYFTMLDRDEIGWNVSASSPLAFESYTWWFPIAGTVPYKGFFDKNYAEELNEELKKEGYDTRVRVIGGYSTLGWFSDPVLSPQLTWKDHRLVGLVFHEMAHATAYLAGDSDLNESYASFVEGKGVEAYYTEKEGKDSSHIKEFFREKNTRASSLKILKNYALKLDSLYKKEIPKEEKLIGKKKIIEEFKMEIVRLKFIPEEKIIEFQKREWNNEDFLGVLRYHSGEDSFEALFEKAKGDFKTFHKLVHELFQLSSEDRKKFLQS
ncbi:aminopeptidase [Leptospira kobayashii]|uniref:aminopeptidase n=1 Tax=Leptospira kobayashii TaxID=1917830 RepID=UPI000D5911A0|nr:aminopeptidase [Leptospira kobayashii]